MPDYTRRLPVPLDAGKRKKLRTLEDVSAFLLSLPQARQSYPGWQSVARLVMTAAEGGDIAKIETAFRLARMHDP
jgi:hypothetical protein